MRTHGHRPPWVAIAWAAVLCWPAPGPARGESPAAALAPDQIRRSVNESQARLRSLRMVYRAEHGPEAPTPGPGESSFSRHTFAARGPLRFVENVHWGDGVPAELDLNHHMGYFTGETLDTFYTNARYAETTRRWARSEFSLKIRAPIVQECLGWWPPDDPTELPPQEPVIVLRKALAREGFVLAPRQEQVDGVWCHVLERPGADKFWFDPAVGFAVRRREVRRGPDAALMVRYEMSDFREAEPGVWLPWKMRRLIYDPTPAPRGRPPRVLKDAVCTVEQVEVNRVPEQLFRFNPPPGTFVKDMDDQSTSQVPGGRDFLDQIIAQARQLPRVYSGGHVAPRRAEAPVWPGYALAAAVAVLTALDTCLIVSGLRTNRVPDPSA